MKPKISPQDYRNILEALELSTISMVDSSFRLKDENISRSLSLDISEKFTFEQKDNGLTVLYSYKLHAQSSEMAEPAISITAKYSVKYAVTKDVIVTKDFMNVFSDLTVSMLLWAYFREYVNNSVYRMGMPPLVLGLKKK